MVGNILAKIYFNLLSLIIMSVLLFPVFAQDQKESENLKLNAGESIVIETEFDVTKIGVGSPDIIEATRISPKQILVNAIQNGKTNLLLWENQALKKEYSIIVGEIEDANTRSEEIKQLLKDVEGVLIRVAGDRVVVEGEVYSQKEIDIVNRVIKDMEGVINLVKTGDVYNRLLAEEIEKTIGIEGVKVRYSRNGYIVEGIVVSQGELDYAVSIADSYTDRVINALYIDPNYAQDRPISGSVQLDLKVIEVNKDDFADLANDFTASGNLELLSSSDARDTAVGSLTLSDGNLRKLQDQGRGRVLLEHSIFAQSGEQASAFIGDEVPIPVSQEGGAISVEYKKIGLKFNLVPSVFEDNTVTLQMSIGSSNITGEGFSGAPQISNLEVSTTANVNNLQNIVVTGLIKQRQLDSYFGTADRSYLNRYARREKDQSIGESDAAFFDSKSASDPNRFTNDRREVLVMVKPKIINSNRNAIKDIKKAVERSFKEYELDRYIDVDLNTVDD